MKSFFENNSKLSTGIIAIIIAFVLIIPIGIVSGAGAFVFGTALGIGASIQSTPVNCKAPPNLFEAWETVRDFVTGVDCDSGCAFGDGGAGGGTAVSADKAAYIKTIIGVGNAMGIPAKGQIVALTTVLVESNLQNYANDGVYDTRKNPADATLSNPGEILGFIKKSLNFPHDAVGSDASSVGLFQQQAWWANTGGSTWGNDPDNAIKRLMDPVFQSQKFYNVLGTIPDWEKMDYGVAAQAVQVSAKPDAYNVRVSEAQSLYNKYKDQGTSNVKLYDLGGPAPGKGSGSSDDSASSGSSCGTSGGTGLPLDKNSLYQITTQWAHPPTGIRQGRVHGGMDIDCGDNYENVYSVVDGVITLATNGNPSGSGYPEGHVYIKAGDGTVFVYRHLRNTFVKAGSQVSAGTPVGECANTGNSYGTHLHIEADVTNSNNAALKALPSAAGINPGLRDPALVLSIMGDDICPPYTANRKQVGVGAPLPATYLKCWPQNEWVR